VNNIINDGEKLLSDLPNYSRLASAGKHLKKELISWRKDKFKEWCHDTNKAIDDPSQPLRLVVFLFFDDQTKKTVCSLETSGRLMEIDSHDGKLRVAYADRLVTLLNEVRQLSSLGYEIPAKIIKFVEIGKKYHQYGVELQAVRLDKHFYLLMKSISLCLVSAFLQYNRLGNDSKSTTINDRSRQELRATC